MVSDAAFDRTKKEYEDKKEERVFQRVDEFKEVQPLKKEKLVTLLFVEVHNWALADQQRTDE